MAEDFRVNFIRQLWTLVLASFILAPFTAPALGRQYGAFLKPNPGARVYLNPNTGRFWTMDSYDGQNQDPLSLHKYLYCQGNPVNHIDPSGHDLGDVMFTMSMQASIFAMRFAPAIRVLTYAGGAIVTAMLVSDEQFRNDFVGVYISSGGNPAAEAQMVYGEMRSLAIALTEARTAVVARAFTTEEQAIITEAKQIYSSSEFAQIKAAKQAGKTLRVTINGRTIQYQPGLPFSGMTWVEQNGFVISDDAFASDDETARTIAHELYRLKTGKALAQGEINQEAAAAETKAAYDFAQLAGDKVK